MNDKHIDAPIQDDEKNKTGLLDLLFVLSRNKKSIIGFPFVAGFVAFVVSLILPPTYRATATMLPPQQAQMGAAALLAQLGGAAGAVASATGMKNPGDVYIGMLKSRTVADRLVKRFNLLKVYDTASMEKARKELELNTSITSGKEGFITVTVEDGDKARVAMLSNAYVDELTKLTRVLAVTEASQRRLFFEQQLEQAKNNLAAAEAALNKGLAENGVISVDSASRALVETIARLRAQVSVKEIQINAMQSFVTVNNQEFKRAQQELSSLRAELNHLENGGGAAAASSNKTPGGLENIKTLREVKYQQMLYEMLAKQYEAARLDEARDGSVIQTLDAAIEPEKQYAPKPIRVAVISALLALFAALTLAYAKDAIARALSEPAANRKWAEFRGQIKVAK